MIFIPLGPGHRPPFFPVITLSIAVITTAISVLNFSAIQNYSNVVRAAAKKQGVMERLLAFHKDHCPTQAMSESQCALASTFLKIGFMPVKDQSKELFSILKDRKKYPPKDVELASDYATSLLHFSGSKDPRVRSIASYEPLIDAFNKSDQEVKPYLAKHALLSRATFSFKTLLLAQLTHEGWFHLLSNLLVFLSFMIYLEQRSQVWASLAIYFVGGSIGLTYELWNFSSDTMPLLGASANIAAVMGAYFVFYLRRNTKWLMSLIFYNKVVEAPTWILVPLLFPASDLAGLMGQASLHSGVAHGAHFVGFLSGALLALGVKAIERIPEPFLYGIEFDLYQKFLRGKEFVARLNIVDEILKYNPDNFKVVHDTCALIASQTEWTKQSVFAGQTFLDKYLGVHLERRSASDPLDQLPLQMSLISSLKNLKPELLVAMAEKHLKSRHWLTAIRLYDVYRSRFPNTENDRKIFQSVKEMVERLVSQSADTSKFNEYLKLETRSTFKNLAITNENKETLKYG